MGKRLHVAQTERKPAPAPAPVLNNDLLKYVARDINHAKANLEPRLFHAALSLLESPSAPVAPLPARAGAHHWQGMIDAAAAHVQRAQLEITQTAPAKAARAALETSAAQTRAAQTSAANAQSVSQQATARTQYWHAQIQRFGIGSYARHYEDRDDFQTRSAQPQPNGETLHPVLLEALEAHFQQKLPAIQIHHDASAASRAREVGALAFTSGAGIHFGAGQYQPFTTDGFKLLVHETAHVLQQARGIVPDGVDTDPSLESAAQLEASRVMNAPSLSNADKPQVSSQQPSSLPFETAGQWAAHLLNTLKSYRVPRERFAVVAELYTQIPVDQQGKAKALMLGKLNPNSSEHQRLETALVVTPRANTSKSSSSSALQGKSRQPGEMNFFTYLNPLERDIVLPNYKAFPISSDAVKASPALEPTAPTLSRSSRTTARALRQPFRATHATTRAVQRAPTQPVAQPKAFNPDLIVDFVLKSAQLFPEGNRGESIVQAFYRYQKSPEQTPLNNAQRNLFFNAVLAKLTNQPKVQAELLKALKQHGIPFTAVDLKVDVSKLSSAEKLREAIKLAPFQEGLKQQVLAAVSLQSLGLFALVFGLGVFAQFTPVGWLADVIIAGLIGFGVYSVGSIIFDVIKDFGDFAQTAVNAKSEADLKVAGAHFADAVAKIGVNVVIALIAHMAAKGVTARVKASAASRLATTPEAIQSKLDAIKQNPAAVNTPVSTAEGLAQGNPKPNSTSAKPGQTRAQYEAQQSQARAGNYKYDPKVRTEPQLKQDLNPALRTNETKPQAQARVKAAQAEIALRDALGLGPRDLPGFSNAQIEALQKILQDSFGNSKLSRDRVLGLRNFLKEYAAKGKNPDKVIKALSQQGKDKTLGDFLEQKAGIKWDPNWRGKPKVEDGNVNEGWQHIKERHITGEQPGGDLFPKGTTRADILKLITETVEKGSRISEKGRRMQTFEKRTMVRGRSIRMRCTVDTSDGRTITAFPVISGP